jgi:exonuclease VII small subunit
MAGAEDAMSKDKKKKKLTPAQYEQKIDELTEHVSFLEGQSREMEIDRDKLKAGLEYSDKCLERSVAETAAAMKEKTALLAQVDDLAARLKWAGTRLTESIEAANHAASATSSVARITHSLTMIIDSLELKLAGENKHRERYRG